MSDLAKLLDLVAPQANGCWHWTGYINDQGYGNRCHVGAHRLVYEALVGPIPDGLSLDHLCHNADLACAGGRSCLHRRCVNPDHLDPTTRAVNILRSTLTIAGRNAVKTHCKRGHEFTERNTIWQGDKRSCRECRYAAQRARYVPAADRAVAS